MKIKYEFANEVIEIEVSDEWGQIVIEMDRQEALNDRRETRRHERLDLTMDESSWLCSGDDDPCDSVAKIERLDEIGMALMSLTRKQRDIFVAVHYYGLGITEYASRKGIAHSTASERLKAAEKNMKKFL